MAQQNYLSPLMILVKGDALSALATPTSHCLHADQLTSFQLPISY